MSIFRHRHIRITGPKPQRDIFIHRKAHDINIRVLGYDNTLRVETDSYRGEICMCGVGNTIILEEGIWVCTPCKIVIGAPACPCYNCTIIIRRNTYLGGVEIMCSEDNSRVEIGERCMFSQQICVWCTDGHTIRRADGSINIGRSITIGEHVWVGWGSKINKNTAIADESMVGWGSIVTGRFEEPHCLIAGVPARVHRQGITWDERRPMDYLPDTDMKKYPDWNTPPPPCALVRPLLHIKLAWFRYLSKHKCEMQKRRKYERKAAEVLRRLES